MGLSLNDIPGVRKLGEWVADAANSDGMRSLGDWWDGTTASDIPEPDRAAFQSDNYQDTEAWYREMLKKQPVKLDARAQQASMGGSFANQQSQLGKLLMQRAQGKGLVSEQLARRGVDDAIRAQSSMAAGARPGQSALAARQAMQNASGAMAGLAGERALAGAAESAQAAGMAGNVVGQARGQEMAGSQFNTAARNQRALDNANLAMANRAQQLQALGQRGNLGMQQAGLNAQFEAAKYDRNKLLAENEGAGWDKAMKLGSTIGGAIMMSDRRAKKHVKDGRPDADEFLRKLHAKKWTYKDRAHGEGRHVGVMAQDLESTRAGRRAVIDTPGGKMVDYGRLAPVLTAALGRVAERVEKLEKGASR